MSKDLDVNKLMDNVKALTVENENLLRENEDYKAKVEKLESDIEGYKRSCEELYKDKCKVEVALADERNKSNAYQRENEILIRKIDSSLTVEELLRHLSKGGGNSVVIGIK
jgi:predicted RNase H-like nuclease (RuvC/YqgF family)